jgi:hypothetical protein
LALGGEYVAADFLDCVVKVLESFRNALPAHVTRQVESGLQAEAGPEQVADDPVKQFLGEMGLLCGGSGIRCWCPGDSRLPGGVDRDQATESAEAEHTPGRSGR